MSKAKENTNSIFSLVENTPIQVILEVNASDPLTIARHPYVNSDMTYITVTKGDTHVLTVVKKNGTTWDFYWGLNGHTRIGEETERLRREVVNFIEDECHINLGMYARY